jgi:hypothetical protein
MAYARGRGFNYFIGEVVSVDSPYQDGTVKVRAYGTEDDKTKIPDESLRWYKVLMPTTHAQLPGSGGIHGLLRGSVVMCIYLDDNEQIPMVIGTITSSGKPAATTV